MMHPRTKLPMSLELIRFIQSFSLVDAIEDTETIKKSFTKKERSGYLLFLRSKIIPMIRRENN